MSNTKNQPEVTLRDGAIKATIWKNEGENGVFFSVEFSRTYSDEKGNPKDTSSFSGSQLLKLARIAQKAYDRTAQLRENEKQDEAA